MATFAAFPENLVVDPGNLYGLFPPAPTFLVIVTATDSEFANVINNSITPDEDTKSAFCALDYFDLMSGNIFIRPVEFNLGFITSTTTVQALIWNTYDVDAEVSSITQEDIGSGVVLTDLIVTDTVGARNDRVINYDVFGIGGASIMDRFDFVFVDGITPLGSVFNTFSGFRGFINLFEPLLNGYAQERLFATDLFRSENGTETRSNLFNDPIPVRKVSMSIKVFRPGDIADLQSLLTFSQALTILVPSWYDESALTADTDGISDEIFLDLTGKEYDVGQQILILKSNIRFCQDREKFSATIVAVNPSSLILSAAPPSGFTIGDIVLPTLLGTPEKSSGWQYVSEKRGLFQLEFSELR